MAKTRYTTEILFAFALVQTLFVGCYDISPIDVKIRTRDLKERTKWLPWDLRHPLLVARKEEIVAAKRPNILLVVADDLVFFSS